LAKDFDVTIVTGKYPNCKNEIIDGVKYERVGTTIFGPKIGQLFFSFVLPFYAGKKDFDMWIESLTPPFSFSFLPILIRKPVIGLAHTLAGKDAARKYLLPFYAVEKFGLRFYKRFIAVSEFVKTEILAANFKAEVVVISNGIELPKETSSKVGKYILFLGRIEVSQKGLDLLLKAYQQIQNKISLPLYIAGAGAAKEENELKKLINNLNLVDCVFLLGRVGEQEKMRLFNRAAFSVVTSRFETFSLTALESLAFGKPVIAFDIPGLSWLEDFIAFKIKPFDIEALGEAIVHLSQNLALQQEMGKRGRELAKKYSWESAAGKYKEFILSVIYNAINQRTTVEPLLLKKEEYPAIAGGGGWGNVGNNSNPSASLRSAPSLIKGRKLPQISFGSNRHKFFLNDLADHIVSQHLPCYFISPHLDDAALSAGNLIADLAKKTEVTIVTVFTKADLDGLNTLSARTYLKQCNFASAEKLYRQRRLEDWQVCEMLGAKAVHLGFTDALWRKKNQPSKFTQSLGRYFSEVLHLYPTYRWHIVSGNMHKQDDQLRQDIIKALSRVIPNKQQAAIFCPAGFGNHIDHLLVRSACEQLFPKAIYWQDMPYGSKLKNYQPIVNRTETVWQGDAQIKQKVLSHYRTQFAALYPSGKLPGGEEKFYV
jgi:glycosyltransferase involved in cell wall biosynthesis/LmbE family N-acetylglucosaminyl deacetylase